MTGKPFTVAMFCSDGTSRRHRTALANLPVTFQETTGKGADVAVVDADAESVARGLAGYPRCIVVEHATALAAGELRSLLRSGIQVYPALQLAPILRQYDATALTREAALIRSSIVSTTSGRETRLEHLTALQALLGPLGETALHYEAEQTYVGIATVLQTGARILWSGRSESCMDRFDLDAVGIRERLEIDASLAGNALSAGVRIADVDGTRRLRPLYESGGRFFWRSVAGRLDGETGAITSLEAAVGLPPSAHIFQSSIS